MVKNDEAMTLSKKVFHNAREIVKLELFGTKRTRPVVVPSIAHMEKVLGIAIAKSVARTPLQLSHLKSNGRWLIALRLNRKTGLLLEGRTKEKWWTITFSHGISRRTREAIVRQVMKKNKNFVGIFNDKVVSRDLDKLILIGKLWKMYCLGPKARRFKTVVREYMEELDEAEKLRKNDWKRQL